jgi:hypothetical protein
MITMRGVEEKIEGESTKEGESMTGVENMTGTGGMSRKEDLKNGGKKGDEQGKIETKLQNRSGSNFIS